MAATPTCWWSTPRPIPTPDRGASPPSWSRRASPGSPTAPISTSWACAARTRPLFFDDCEVPEENVLGGVGNGVKVLMTGLDYERAVLCGGPLGIMEACMDVVMPYVHRAQAVRPADRRVPAHAGQARRHVHDLGCDPRLCLCGGEGLRPLGPSRALRKDAAGAILYAAEKATWMAGEAIQVLGGNGYINDFPPAGCCATPSSTRSAPAPAKSAAC